MCFIMWVTNSVLPETKICSLIDSAEGHFGNRRWFNSYFCPMKPSWYWGFHSAPEVPLTELCGLILPWVLSQQVVLVNSWLLLTLSTMQEALHWHHKISYGKGFGTWECPIRSSTSSGVCATMLCQQRATCFEDKLLHQTLVSSVMGCLRMLCMLSSFVRKWKLCGVLYTGPSKLHPPPPWIFVI